MVLINALPYGAVLCLLCDIYTYKQNRIEFISLWSHIGMICCWTTYLLLWHKDSVTNSFLNHFTSQYFECILKESTLCYLTTLLKMILIIQLTY